MSTNRYCTAALSLAVLLFGEVVATRALAGSINYGDVAGNTVVYRQVTESSTNPGVPLYGAPMASGDSLQFQPQQFQAQSGSGVNIGLLDFVDGTLNTSIKADMGRVINSITVAEQGDFSLVGAGATATIAAPIILRIDQVNNVALVSPIFTTASLVFTSGSGGPGSYATPGDQGIGNIWTGTVSVNIAAVLAANNITGGATTIQWTMDNALTAYSPAGGLAFIKKKDIGGVAITVGTGIPEPSSIVLAALGMAAVLVGACRQAKRKLPS